MVVLVDPEAEARVWEALAAAKLPPSTSPPPVWRPSDWHDDLWHPAAGTLAVQLPPPGELAYVMFTSGSSGSPKGVLGTTAGLLNRCAWAASAFPAQPEDVGALRTSPAFVDAAAELWAPLLDGIPLAVLPPGVDADPLALVSSLVVHRVTRLTCVASILAAALPALRSAGGLRLTTVLCSGEPLYVWLYTAACAALGPGVRIINVYGSTETAADCVAFDPAAERWLPPPQTTGGHHQVPIGRPLPGFWAAVLDGRTGQPVTEAGQLGELIIGGIGVALGYLHDPQLTADRFPTVRRGAGHDSPVVAHRTGDVAAWAPDGTLRLLGRVGGTAGYDVPDDVGLACASQVKVRGVRVDLAEVEAQLQAHPDVLLAAVACWPRAAGDPDPRIVGYAVVRPGAAAMPRIDGSLAGALRAFLTRRVPAAAVPVTVVLLNHLPRNSSQKVDRAQLPEPDWGALAAGANGAAPVVVVATPGDVAACAAAFAGALRVPESDVGPDTDFWLAGGTSLSAAMLCGRLGITVQALLDHPTPASLAPHVRASVGHVHDVTLEDGDGSEPPAKRLRMAASADTAAPPDSAWVPARALSFAGRMDMLAGVLVADPLHGQQQKVASRSGSGTNHATLLSPSSASTLGTAATENRGEEAPVQGHLGMEALWSVPLGACVDASPMLLLPAPPASSWRCIVGSHAGIACCVECPSPHGDGGPNQAQAPTVIWSTLLDGRIEASAAAVHVPCPSGDSDGMCLVVVGTHGGALSFLDARDGHVAATHPLVGAIKAAPGVDSWARRTWAACHGRTACAVGATLGAGGKVTLRVDWQASLDGAVSAAPAFDAARRRVYFATLAGSMYAVDDSGCDATPPRQPALAWHSTCVGSSVFGAPLVMPSSGDVIMCCADGALKCLRCGDGALQWSISPPGPQGPLFGGPLLVGTHHLVLGTNGGHVVCFHVTTAQDGGSAATVAWDVPVCPASRLVASPSLDVLPPAWAASQGRVMLVVAAAKGDIAVLSAPAPGEEGEEGAAPAPPVVVARAALPADVFSGPVAHGGMIVVGCRDDCVYGLRLAKAAPS